MSKTSIKNNIWEELIEFSSQRPCNWQAYESEYEIKKLELEKLEIQEIREKRADFQKKYLADHQISKSWMENEYRLFIWFLFTYSQYLILPPQLFDIHQWVTVSECFNKQPLFCQYFYLSCKKIKSPDWKANEDAFIHKLMNSNLTKKWTEIGLELYIRSGGSFFRKPKSIRERWLSHLNPSIKKDDWDSKQDLRLVKSIKEMGRKWSKIAKLFGDRTEHTIKNRYNQLITKHLKQESCKKIGLQMQTEEQKLEFIQEQILKAQKVCPMRSRETLPECQVSQTKIQATEELQISMKLFNPIILSMPLDYENDARN